MSSKPTSNRHIFTAQDSGPVRTDQFLDTSKLMARMYRALPKKSPAE